MKQLRYNLQMPKEIHINNVSLLTIPRKEKWSGAQIHKMIEGVEKQYKVASGLNILPEVKTQYRELLTDLIKTYGH